MTDDQRLVGQTRSAGFQIGLRRTLPIGHEAAWRLVTSPEGVRAWLGGTFDGELVKGAQFRLADGTMGQVTVYAQLSHMRLTWQPPQWQRPSIIQLRVMPHGDRTVIAFHQEQLPGPAEREERRAFFLEAMERLEAMLERYEPS